MQFGDFDILEYHCRYRRLQAALQKAGIDALVVTQPENCRYFAGTLTQSWAVKSYQYPSILPADPRLDPVTLVGWGDEHISTTSWISNLKRFEWVDGLNTGESVPKTIAEVLADMGLSKGTIGLELSEEFRINLAPPCVDSLYKLLPHAKFVDAYESIWQVRAIKSPAEIERLRKVCDISIHALRHVFESLRPGMTEREVARMMAMKMYELGADEVRYMTFYAWPERAMWADSVPSDYMFTSPGRIQFDGGGVYRGYYADFKRMATAGELSEEDKRDYEILRSAHEACFDALRVGNTCGDVFEAAMKAFEKAGQSMFADWCRNNYITCVGHGLGLDIHEEPLLSMGRKRKIEANMVLNIEPLFTFRGTTPFHGSPSRIGIEDTVLITENGPELLTPTEIISWDLWRV